VLQVARADGGVTSNWIHDSLGIGESVKVSGAYGTFIGDPAWTPRCCAWPPAPAWPHPGPHRSRPAARLPQAGHPALLGPQRSRRLQPGMMAWWRTKHRSFDYKITLTRESRDGCLAGRVDAVLPGLFPDLSKHTVFAAGSPAFGQLRGHRNGPRRSRERIHTEGFFAQQQPVVADADHLLTF
jgi:CDP-4-dehydro-6-deoxyglucose reductase